MIPISVLQLYVQAAIIERHPELNSLVTFDINVPAFHPGMFFAEVRVTALDHAALCDIAAKIEPNPYGVERRWPLGKILDHYCNNEPHAGCDFILGGREWLIGDGDDSLAVSEVSFDAVILWVRTWD